MAQRYTHRRLELTVGIEGIADMNRDVALANWVESDPGLCKNSYIREM